MDNNIGTQLAEQAVEVTHEKLVQLLYNQTSPDLLTIRQAIESFNTTANYYLREMYAAKKTGNITVLESLVDKLYGNFFRIQNMLNAYLGQRIVLTYVHINSDGSREIRISNNDISHLAVQNPETPWGQKFVRYGYEVNNHYQLLKNSLPDSDNQILSDTAAEVTNRREKNKSHIVFWERKNKMREKVGYYVGTKGPINEAYVNFYVHNIKFKESLDIEQRVGRFMLDAQYGAIKADNTKGYFIGDVERDGIQYAVKGVYGGPQGISQIIKEFKKIQEQGFSMAAFYNFIEKFTIKELEKNYKPHIKKMVPKEVEKLIKELKT